MKNPEKYSVYLRESISDCDHLLKALQEHLEGNRERLEKYNDLISRLLEGVSLSQSMLKSRVTDRMALTLLLGFCVEIEYRLDNLNCVNWAKSTAQDAGDALAAIDGY